MLVATFVMSIPIVISFFFVEQIMSLFVASCQNTNVCVLAGQFSSWTTLALGPMMLTKIVYVFFQVVPISTGDASRLCGRPFCDGFAICHCSAYALCARKDCLANPGRELGHAHKSTPSAFASTIKG